MIKTKSCSPRIDHTVGDRSSSSSPTTSFVDEESEAQNQVVMGKGERKKRGVICNILKNKNNKIK